MTYVQGGAVTTAAGMLYPTKKALREAIKLDPSGVWLSDTSALAPVPSVTADQMPEGVNWVVVGPDPYNRRNWYATVKRTGSVVKVT